MTAFSRSLCVHVRPLPRARQWRTAARTTPRTQHLLHVKWRTRFKASGKPVQAGPDMIRERQSIRPVIIGNSWRVTPALYIYQVPDSRRRRFRADDFGLHTTPPSIGCTTVSFLGENLLRYSTALRSPVGRKKHAQLSQRPNAAAVFRERPRHRNRFSLKRLTFSFSICAARAA